MIQPQYLQQQYPQAPSAVSINIYEPKSYGSAPQAQAPYGYTNQLYSMPQTSAWGPQSPQGIQSPYQQYAPQYQPMIPQYTPQAAPMAPTPMPQSAIEPQQAPQAQAAEQAQPPMPEVKEGEQGPKVNTDALLKDLASTDYNAQAEAITSVANFTQATPDIALQVATDPVKQALVDIIKADTTALPEATEQQQALADKQNKGEKLTPEEQAQMEQLSPKVAANKNKIFALFTLAMVQKLARDNNEQYSQFQAEQGKPAGEQIALKDLMGYKEIVDTIQNEPNKELRVAAIQALQYIAKPEEKAQVQEALKTALEDKEPSVQQTAKEAIAKLGDMPQGPEASLTEEATHAPAADVTAQTEQEQKQAA